MLPYLPTLAFYACSLFWPISVTGQSELLPAHTTSRSSTLIRSILTTSFSNSAIPPPSPDITSSTSIAVRLPESEPAPVVQERKLSAAGLTIVGASSLSPSECQLICPQAVTATLVCIFLLIALILVLKRRKRAAEGRERRFLSAEEYRERTQGRVPTVSFLIANICVWPDTVAPETACEQDRRSWFATAVSRC